ncbi:uncharacterized protein LOC143841710 [Paroedura picta]|uniref:uncharacterized protein LOC143841710 n=1 Tax=Paroedura picta TaxID=143630 RepID=UPI004055FFA6
MAGRRASERAGRRRDGTGEQASGLAGRPPSPSPSPSPPPRSSRQRVCSALRRRARPSGGGPSHGARVTHAAPPRPAPEGRPAAPPQPPSGRTTTPPPPAPGRPREAPQTQRPRRPPERSASGRWSLAWGRKGGWRRAQAGSALPARGACASAGTLFARQPPRRGPALASLSGRAEERLPRQPSERPREPCREAGAGGSPQQLARSYSGRGEPRLPGQHACEQSAHAREEGRRGERTARAGDVGLRHCAAAACFSFPAAILPSSACVRWAPASLRGLRLLGLPRAGYFLPRRYKETPSSLSPGGGGGSLGRRPRGGRVRRGFPVERVPEFGAATGARFPGLALPGWASAAGAWAGWGLCGALQSPWPGRACFGCPSGWFGPPGSVEGTAQIPA